MLIRKRVKSDGFISNLLSVNLFLILLTFGNSQKLGSPCRTDNEVIGTCKTLQQCSSAYKNGNKPVLCSPENGGMAFFVCCHESNPTPDGIRNDGQSYRTSKSWLNQHDRPRTKPTYPSRDDDDDDRPKTGTKRGAEIESIFDVQRVSQDPNYYERKKHSINNFGPNLNEENVRNDYGRRKYYGNDDENDYVSHKKSTTSYTEEINKYKPNRRPTTSSSQLVDYGSQREEDDYDPYKKRKPWNEEKPSPDIHQYQYEYVTKKPSWSNYDNRPTTKRYDYYETTKRNNWSDQNNQKTTKRYDWSNQDNQEVPNNYDWQSQNRQTTKRYDWSNQGNRPNNNYDWQSQNKPTTKRNEWSNQNEGDGWSNQQTTKKPEWFYQENSRQTTKRSQWSNSENNPNNWSVEENSADSYYTKTTTRRPYQTTTSRGQNNYHRPTSRPQENDRPSREPATKRISEIKCQEYSQEVTETIAGLPLMTNPKPVKINIKKCIQAQGLIVGGENTTIGEFPHMAAVGFRDHNERGIAWNCGGSLISEEFVLTAAHCTSTSQGPPVMVRLGEYNLKRNDDGAHPVDYSIKEIIKHPDYKPPSKYNDIALLRLSRRVSFHKNIRPACLYTKDTFSTKTTIATGWGRIDYAEQPSEVLLKVNISIIDNSICNRLYQNNVRSDILSRGIIESQMCAGELKGGRDTCQGDSGGPIEVTSQSNECIHHIIGVTSFGKHCAQPNAPGVYTRVSAYVPWIESIVWPQREWK